jgi:hypothetical protein
MSEELFEPGYEFEPGYDFGDAEEALSTTGDGVVTSRLFHEDGSPRDGPGPGSSGELWQAWADALPEEPAGPPEVDWESLSAEEITDDFAAMTEAAEQVQRERMLEARLDYVAERSRAGGFGVRDRGAFARVDRVIGEAQDSAYRSLLASGWTPSQAAEQVSDGDYDAIIDALLAGERYAQVTSNTKMGQRRQARAAQAALDARLGLEPAPSVFETSPQLQRLARTLGRQAERVAARNEWMRDRGFG